MSPKLSPVWVVIPAAGIGQRMQSELPKQYLKINNKTVIEHTLACFTRHDQIAGIVVVLSAKDQYWQTVNIEPHKKPVLTVIGGSERSDSVLQGLQYLNQQAHISNDSWVMVHDAARPFLSEQDLDALLLIRTKDCIGGILAAPVKDTMKRTAQTDKVKTILHTESRDNLWHALTPQLFRLGQLSTAMQQCKLENIQITDECSAIEYSGFKPIIVEGSHYNIKITYPEDVKLANYLFNSKESTSQS